MKNSIMGFIYTLILKNGERIYDVKTDGQTFSISITFQSRTDSPYHFTIRPDMMFHPYMDKYDIFTYKDMRLRQGP